MNNPTIMDRIHWQMVLIDKCRKNQIVVNQIYEALKDIISEINTNIPIANVAKLKT